MTATVRSALPSDVPQLLNLMRGLAVFEDYTDDFAVTGDDLLRHGFGRTPLFQAHAACVGTQETPRLVGMAVTYAVPWTYTLKPRLVLKELFVQADARGSGVGRALMNAVMAQASMIGADHISRTVMNGNSDAELFYRSIGGEPDRKWNNWALKLTPVNNQNHS